MQAKELGIRTVIIDGPDSWAQSLKTEGMIERFVGLDFADADTVFDRCMDAINKVKKVHKLTTLSALAVPSEQDQLCYGLLSTHVIDTLCHKSCHIRSKSML